MKISKWIATALLAAFALSACVAGIIVPVPVGSTRSTQNADENQRH